MSCTMKNPYICDRSEKKEISYIQIHCVTANTFKQQKNERIVSKLWVNESGYTGLGCCALWL